MRRLPWQRNAAICRPSVSDGYLNQRRFAEWSGGDASDIDGRPVKANERERVSQTALQSLRSNWFFLNFVCVFCKLIAKYTRETNVVQNDHIGVVFFVVVVLPPFIPPAETDDAGPSI
jgi:hypothetical protein